MTDIELTIDGPTRSPQSAVNQIVTQDVSQDKEATKKILDKYTALTAPLANEVIGEDHAGHPLST